MVGGRSGQRSSWFKARAASAAQPSWRIPGQPQLDVGKPYYDPERIKVPTLVVVAEWDQLTPSQGAQALFHKLPSGPNKRLVEIGEGTHIVMLEKNRLQLFQEVQSFLESARRD